MATPCGLERRGQPGSDSFRGREPAPHSEQTPCLGPASLGQPRRGRAANRQLDMLDVCDYMSTRDFNTIARERATQLGTQVGFAAIIFLLCCLLLWKFLAIPALVAPLWHIDHTLTEVNDKLAIIERNSWTGLRDLRSPQP